jgi:hypothetical protein
MSITTYVDDMLHIVYYLENPGGLPSCLVDIASTIGWVTIGRALAA